MLFDTQILAIDAEAANFLLLITGGIFLPPAPAFEDSRIVEDFASYNFFCHCRSSVVPHLVMA